MRYIVEHEPTPENIQILIEAAAKVESEWITVIRCAYEAGIKTSIGRHLGPSNLNGEEIRFQHSLSVGLTRRLVGEELAAYLRHLPKETGHFCPRLHEMTTDQFANSWCDVCAVAGFKMQLITLTWPYRKTHEQESNWERTRSYLESLAKNLLTTPEIEQLECDAKRWLTMGSKSKNRKRLLTRKQILAPVQGMNRA